MSTLQIGLNGQSITLVIIPMSPERASVEFDLSDAVALVTSEFTGQVQAQKWPGADMLSGKMTLPPLTPAQGNDWLAFLMQCRGMANAFLLGDPLRIAPSGSGSGAPFVDNTQNGGNPAGSEWLGTKGWTANAQGVLKRGDCFCTDWRLYYVLDDANADSSGKALINVWPTLREQPAQDGSSNFWQNATGSSALTEGHPLGSWVWYAEWSEFALIPGVNLPDDAVIQGIYPVMVLTNNATNVTAALFGTNLDPASWTVPGGTGIPQPSIPYTSPTLCYFGTSIGNTLEALNGQAMAIQSGGTLANPSTGAIVASAVGFAIYYTSATPKIDPSIAPPFSVPSGQGLAWAMPFEASAGSMEPDNNGSSAATPAVLNGAIGLYRPTGLFRLASNKRTWSADPSKISRMSFAVQELR